ncbi:MAG TPA: imidazole glycerol phosphate synthase subunit HisF [Gemmatimonadaceae bacterium]|jgi:cyclase
MSLSRRVIVCLDVRGGRVVKGTHFQALRDIGDPSEMASNYEQESADEIVFLDISASIEERATLLASVRRTAEQVFIPLTVGGGIRSVDDAAQVLRAGADKVAVNSAAVTQPALLSELADRFGRQCVVASIDAKRGGHGWRVFTHGGTRPTKLDATEWAARCAECGAGEILVTSIDSDGTRDGYDLELTAAVSVAVDVPVIASGGAGSTEHVVAALTRGAADAALVAGMVHDGSVRVPDIKRRLALAGLPIREVA